MTEQVRDLCPPQRHFNGVQLLPSPPWLHLNENIFLALRRSVCFLIPEHKPWKLQKWSALAVDRSRHNLYCILAEYQTARTNSHSLVHLKVNFTTEGSLDPSGMERSGEKHSTVGDRTREERINCEGVWGRG